MLWLDSGGRGLFVTCPRQPHLELEPGHLIQEHVPSPCCSWDCFVMAIGFHQFFPGGFWGRYSECGTCYLTLPGAGNHGKHTCSEGKLLLCCWRAPRHLWNWGQWREGAGRANSRARPTANLLGDFLKRPLIFGAGVRVCKNGDTTILAGSLKSVMKAAANILKGKSLY